MRLGFQEAVNVIEHAFELGITFFDTANAYGDSEKKMGHALEPVRDKVIFATKTLAREAPKAARHVALSLENLRASSIEIYQIHQVAEEKTLDQVLSAGGAYEALDKARSQGKIRFIGITSHNLDTAIKACRTGLFDTIQIPFNFIEREPAEELFGVARERNMGIIGMKPMGGGLLERADLCFQFLQQYPEAVPIPGVQARQELDEIVELYRIRPPLGEVHWKEIEKIRSQLGSKFCHRCEYCMPCERGVEIPGVLRFKSVWRRFPPSRAIALVKGAMDTVEKCEECWECVERCPYDLPIPDLIKENLALFKECVARNDG